MKKYVIIALVLVVAIGIGMAIQKYNEGPRDLQAEQSDLVINAPALVTAFTADETAANARYLDKVVEVSGTVEQLDRASGNVHLSSDDPLALVVCEMAAGQDLSGIEEGNEISVKGQCTGYLSDVILVKCVLIK